MVRCRGRGSWVLLDLRRRRERLGFASAATQQQRTTSNANAPRDARSNSQTPLRSQKPQQAAPAPRAPEAKAAPRSSQQPGNAIATAGKPRRRREVAPVAAADAQAIVPFHGGGGGKLKPVVASNVDVQMAALALALSDGGKLRNIEIMARNGSVFLRGPDTPAHHRGGASGVAIGVQDLNDMLMAAYSSGGGRRRSDEAGKKLFRGSMDMEEALSMLVMLQDASGYMEGSGSGKVLLLKGKENRESSATTTRSPSSARIVEIVDEESETEEAKNASMQIVVHDEFVQSHQSTNSSSVMQSGPSDSKTSNASQGKNDGSKVRMPSVIAKLMGLENLPSLAAKTVAERKGTERFVKPEAVPRMEIRANAMDRKLPIRIVASEKVLSKGQHAILLPGEWKSSLTNFGESEPPNSSSHPATGNKHVRLTMRDVLRKMVGAERGADGSQGVDERIIHEDKTFTEEIKLQKPVSVGCRNDSGKKMDFLKRFRKNSDNRPAIEDKHTIEEKVASVGKKQATGMKRLLGRDSETKSRRAREKLNKENLATAETKAAVKNGKADQVKRQAQGKHMDRQTTPRKARNCREMQSETLSRNLVDKNSVMSEAAHMKNKPEYMAVIRQEDEEHAKVNDISFSKLSDVDGGVSEELAIVVRDSSTTGAASSDQTSQKITEGASDPRIPVQTVVQASEHLKFMDQIATSEVHVRDSSRTGAASSDQPLQKVTEGASDPTLPVKAVVHASEELKFLDQSATSETHDGRINHTTTETTQISETVAEDEHQQTQQQQMIVKEQLTDGPDHITTSSDLTGSQDQTTHVVSCDSFTDNQLLLVRMLAKDKYLLETAKAIVRVHDPVSFIDDDAGARNRPDKGNYGLLSDVAREVIRKKGKRTEAMEEVSVARIANPKQRCLDDLVRELDGDVESLQNISRKPHRQSDNRAAEGLQMILQSDIQNDHPDANSTWDFGWNRVSELPIEKNEVVRDLEKNILGGIITDVARDLIGVSVRLGCCACLAA